MQPRAWWIWLGIAFVTSCKGSVSENAGDPAGSNAGAAGSNAGAAGSNAGAAGSTGTSTAACGPSYPSMCVAFCGAEMMDPECVKDQWVCPGTWFDECPPGTCAMAPTFPCCDGDNNEIPPVCNEMGSNPQCPPGTEWAEAATCGVPLGGECWPSKPCEDWAYCDYPDDECGVSATGICAEREGCSYYPDEPVCACDGEVYANPDCATSEGQDLNRLGGCTTPLGTFPCGTHFCQSNSTYCQHELPDSLSSTHGYECLMLPLGCSECSCLANQPCGNDCQADTEGNLTLTCQGG